MLNIAKAKCVLLKALYDVICNKLSNNDFKLLLKYFYTHDDLKDNAKDWIKQIEKTQANDLESIIIHNNAKKFYYAWSCSKNYQYYVNKLGIVILVKTTGQNNYEYAIKDKNNKCWFIEIDDDGNIKGEKFNQKYKDFPKLQNDAIYKLIRSGYFNPYEKEKTELLNIMEKNGKHFFGIALHHIVNIPGNDARDNRIDNIICLPTFLHCGRHSTNISGQEKKYAQEIYKKYM